MYQAGEVQNGFEAQKLNLLEQMLHIAQTQMTSIEQDRPDEFLRALKQRERVIRRIERLEANKASAIHETVTETDNAEQIRHMIEGILTIDRQCSAVADQKLLIYKSGIKSITQASKQLGAYSHTYCAAQGIFFDMKK